MFKGQIILPMHESMEKLYQFVEESEAISGQSNLAREMNAAPQVINNWEARGISEKGALQAQARFGCDANWLLGTPLMRYRQQRMDKPHIASEVTRPWAWPFKKINPLEWSTLDEDQKKHIEDGVAMLLRSRHAAENKLPYAKVGNKRDH